MWLVRQSRKDLQAGVTQDLNYTGCMETHIISNNSLIVYKTQPGRVRQSGERIEIELRSGELVKVRLKDVILLHPGPLHSLDALGAPGGDVATAWEILSMDDQPHKLAELAELVYGEFTPSTAWAAWRLLEDGLYFYGTPDSLQAHSVEEVAVEQSTRQARARQAEAWEDFLARARAGRFSREKDHRYLQEVEDLASGKRTDSRVMRELGHAERAETAHDWLLGHHLWDVSVDPYPTRFRLPTAPVDLPVPDLPDEARRDLTDLPAYAIDDQGNQDPDDAVSLEGEKLWVHVADVAALITPGSPVDNEGRARGANLYLPEGTVGMLPEAAVQRLGLGLNEISPALSFGLKVDQDGRLQEIEITPSWVRVHRLSYDEAENLLEQEPLKSLQRLAQDVYRRRLVNHAIEINLPETIVRVIDGRVSIRPVINLHSRAMVKEAMLLAGEAAARFAVEHDLAFPFITQEAPDPSVQQLAMSPPGGNDMAVAFMLRKGQKRSLASVKPGQHAGLGLPIYARVTSPLRRYTDLIAHQQLRTYLRGATVLDETALLERLGEAEAVSGAVSQAEGLARRHWTLVFLTQHTDWRGEGVLVEKRAGRGKLIIPELALETQVHLRQDLPLNSRLALAYKGVNLANLEAYFSLV